MVAMAYLILSREGCVMYDLPTVPETDGSIEPTFDTLLQPTSQTIRHNQSHPCLLLCTKSGDAFTTGPLPDPA